MGRYIAAIAIEIDWDALKRQGPDDINHTGPFRALSTKLTKL